MDFNQLKNYKDAFILYEIANHGVDPRESLEGTLLRLKTGRGEGYKYTDFDRCNALIIKGKPYLGKVADCISMTNLVDYHQKHRLTEKLSEEARIKTESALSLIYDEDDDETAFTVLADSIGGYFDIISFCFFVKDCNKYLPVRSSIFDDKLKKLGVKSELSGNCTWEKYSEFIGYVKEIQAFLKKSLNNDITLLDAHSFLWILPDIEEYISMQSHIVEHKKYGKGIVSDEDDRYIYVAFGKEKRQFEKEVVFSKGILKFVLEDTEPKDVLEENKLNFGISEDEWVKLISDPEIFYEKDKNLIKRIYLGDDHAVTCYDLSVQDGVHPSSFISPVVSLAKRIARAKDISGIASDNVSVSWWPILFWGRNREDGHFEWKLQPELASAIKHIYPELDEIAINNELDDELVNDLKNATFNGIEGRFEYKGQPKEKPEPVITKGQKTYPRDRGVAANALSHADYKCEIDVEHPTFIRRNSDKEYTETHHLVPMAYSDRFEVSLDVEENIVSLCSNCHNEIHYGRDAADLIKQLYDLRKSALESVKIKVTLEELLEMYK